MNTAANNHENRHGQPLFKRETSLNGETALIFLGLVAATSLANNGYSRVRWFAKASAVQYPTKCISFSYGVVHSISGLSAAADKDSKQFLEGLVRFAS